jgi:hypothetical protein
VPPIFAGQRLLAYGVVREASALPTGVRLSATAASGRQTWDVPVPDVLVRGSVVTTLAARARIRELEESDDWISGRGSQQRERKVSTVRQQIIDIAVRHGLVSRETSYVAIERRDTPVVGPMQLRRIPIALASGWGGLQAPSSGLQRRHTVLASSLGPPEFAVRGSVDQFGAAALRDTSTSDFLVVRSRALGQNAAGPVNELAKLGTRFIDRVRRIGADARVPGRARPGQLDALVALQAADGAWDLDQWLAGVLGRRLRDLERAMPTSLGSHADARRLWATALALAWLEAQASPWQEEWRLLADKARRRLDAALPLGSSSLRAAAAAAI